jgi:hypothetical protein
MKDRLSAGHPTLECTVRHNTNLPYSVYSQNSAGFDASNFYQPFVLGLGFKRWGGLEGGYGPDGSYNASCDCTGYEVHHNGFPDNAQTALGKYKSACDSVHWPESSYWINFNLIFNFLSCSAL